MVAGSNHRNLIVLIFGDIELAIDHLDVSRGVNTQLALNLQVRSTDKEQLVGFLGDGVDITVGFIENPFGNIDPERLTNRFGGKLSQSSCQKRTINKKYRTYIDF